MEQMISIRSGKATRLSKQQAKALGMIDEIERELSGHSGIKECGWRRWFVQEELHDITLHSMKALVEKGYLERIKVMGHLYYRVV